MDNDYDNDNDNYGNDNDCWTIVCFIGAWNKNNLPTLIHYVNVNKWCL